MNLYVGDNVYTCKPMKEKQWRNAKRNKVTIGMSVDKKFYDIWEVNGLYYYDEDEVEV